MSALGTDWQTNQNGDDAVVFIDGDTSLNTVGHRDGLEFPFDRH
ncbi:hypothetical protein ACFQGT_18925 [Natrialbaceae archaeon GCM10025810]